MSKIIEQKKNIIEVSSGPQLKFDVDRSKPCPQCWTCGRKIPEKDYEYFHENGGNELDFDDEDKTVLIGKLLDDMGYPCKGCRRMFIGDPYEFRRITGLYKKEDIDNIYDSPQLL